MPADNVILGNYIGTDVTGKKALPNATDGVMDIGYPSEDTIGGTVAGTGNIIAFNGGAAVNAEDAFIQQNSIFANGSGINSAYEAPDARGGRFQRRRWQHADTGVWRCGVHDRVFLQRPGGPTW